MTGPTGQLLTGVGIIQRAKWAVNSPLCHAHVEHAELPLIIFHCVGWFIDFATNDPKYNQI